jgi:hypothetical protein
MMEVVKGATCVRVELHGVDENQNPVTINAFFTTSTSVEYISAWSANELIDGRVDSINMTWMYPEKTQTEDGPQMYHKSSVSCTCGDEMCTDITPRCQSRLMASQDCKISSLEPEEHYEAWMDEFEIVPGPSSHPAGKKTVEKDPLPHVHSGKKTKEQEEGE